MKVKQCVATSADAPWCVFVLGIILGIILVIQGAGRTPITLLMHIGMRPCLSFTALAEG